MDHKLSNALATLSAKTKSVEDRIIQAKAENREKLDADLAAVKADAEARKNEFIAKADAAKSSVETKISDAKNSFQEKIAQLNAQAKAKKAEIEDKIANAEHNRDVRFAESDYEDAIYYAQNCIDWAIIALADVEEATLEAFKAKINLENLRNA